MKGTTQRRLRDLHSWFGLFFAPGIMFFALSGLFQTLGLHEARPGKQPITPWIGVLASVHKEAEAVAPKPHEMPHGAPATSASPPPPQRESGVGFPLFKAYALLLSLSLIVSTTFGIAIALAGQAARRRTWTLLAAGCVVPLLLLLV